MNILCRIGIHRKSGEYFEFYGKLLELCHRCGCFHEVKGKGL